MKKIMNNFLKAFAISLFILFSYSAIADNPPPPPGSGSNTQANKLGGKAPVGSGLLLLIGLGAAYGGKKIYDNKKNFSTKE